MKKVLSKLWLLTIMSTVFISCNSSRPNGWYYIIDGAKDSVSINPIVTVADFETLKLDSSVNHKRGEIIYYYCPIKNNYA